MANIPSITDYGAVSGAADNTTAIQTAFYSAGEMYIPPGQFKTGGLTVPSGLQKLWGPGVLVANGIPANNPLLNVADRGQARILLEEFTLVLSAGVTGVSARASSAQVRGLSILGGTYGIWMNGSSAALVEDCSIYQFSTCAIMLNNPAQATVRRNVVTAWPPESLNWHVIGIVGGGDVVLRDNSVYGSANGGFGTFLSGVTRAQVHGHYRASRAEAIAFSGCVDVSVEPGTKCAWNPGESRDFAISLGHDAVPTRGCRIAGVQIRGCGKSGIYVGGNSQFTLIEGGSIFDANMLAGTNPTPNYSDGVTVGGLGFESTLTNTRIFGLTVANDQYTNTQYGVREQSGPGGTPSKTKVTCLNAVSMVAGPQLLVGTGSIA
jgi:hypothetical protein